MKRRLIVFHTESIYSRGGEKYLYQILRRLTKKYTIVLFLQKISLDWRKRYIQEGVSIKIFWTPPRFYWFLLPFTLLVNYLRLRGVIKKNDIIFATNFPTNILAVMLSSKTIIHCFEPLAVFYDPVRTASLPWISRQSVLIAGFLYKWLDIYAVRNCAILTTLNLAVQQYILKTYKRTANGFIPNGIDTIFFNPKAQKLKSNVLYIGHSTDYTVFKGTEQFINALPLVLQKLAAPIMVYISESIHDETVYRRYRSLLKTQGIDKYVQFVGNLSERDMRDFYRRIDVFCYTGSPKCPGGSTASLSVLEAQSCGVPVLRTTGTNDEIIDGKSGIFIQSFTPEGIAGALCTFFLLSKQSRQEMRKRAREHVKKRFSWERSSQAMEKFIQKIMDN